MCTQPSMKNYTSLLVLITESSLSIQIQNKDFECYWVWRNSPPQASTWKNFMEWLLLQRIFYYVMIQHIIDHEEVVLWVVNLRSNLLIWNVWTYYPCIDKKLIQLIVSDLNRDSQCMLEWDKLLRRFNCFWHAWQNADEWIYALTKNQHCWCSLCLHEERTLQSISNAQQQISVFLKGLLSSATGLNLKQSLWICCFNLLSVRQCLAYCHAW